MSDTSKIPIPWTQRWRTIRFQVLPYFFFAFCVIFTVALWNRHAGNPNAIGEVFAQRIDLTSTGDGVLIEVPGQRLELFEPVKAGQVIARIDDGAIQGELELYKGELETLLAAVKGTAEEMKLEHEDRLAKYREDKRRWEDMFNKAKIEYVKAKSDMKEAEAELTGVLEELSVLEGANRQVIAFSRTEILALRTQEKRLREVISQSKAIMIEANAQGTAANKVLKEYPPEPTADLEVLSGEAVAEAEAKRKLIEATELRLSSLEIRAPIDGVISTLYYRPGATLRLGEPIMTIAANEGQFILSYVRQGRNLEPQPQMVVDVRRRVIPREAGKGYIERVGSQVELVPPNQCRDPRAMEWGLPVQIRIPTNLKLRPGELVDLRLEPAATLSQNFPVQRADSYAGVVRPISSPANVKTPTTGSRSH
jgi:multidrug resistance efflux pump